MIIMLKKTIEVPTEMSAMGPEELIKRYKGELVAHIKEQRIEIDELRRSTKVACDKSPALNQESLFADEPPLADYAHGNAGASIGRKNGTTSKYHYVHWNTKRKRWLGQVCRIQVCRSTHEIDTALLIDAYLDGTNDTDRPRNRDEHAEVMSAYKLNNMEK